MGRVSRILKAAGDRGKEHIPTGLEGPPKALEASSSAQPDSRTDSDDLSRVIACWTKLPAHFKQTILTLVAVAEATK